MVGPFPPTKGGVTTFMLRLMDSRLNERFDFVPFTTSRPPKKNTLNNWGYAAMLRGGIGRLFFGIGVTAWHVLQFPFVLFARNINIVQIQASDYQAFWEAAAYALLAKSCGKRVVFRIGGAFDLFFESSPRRVQQAIRSVLCRPDHIVAQSDIAKAFIARVGADRPIIVVPNWAADDDIHVMSRLGRDNAKFLFIAGSDAKRKGYEEVLGAARILQDKGSTARFVWVGVPPVLAELIEQARLQNIVGIDGFVSRERILQAMREADVLLLPSHGEGFPNSLIEALSCGMPAIATPVGAVPEIAAGGGVRLVPVGDAAELADAIAALADDEALRAQMGNEALENVRRRYTEDSVLPRLADVYEHLLDPTKPAGVLSPSPNR
jgi:glycosyltransferase involved in cell wall biosynthesis